MNSKCLYKHKEYTGFSTLIYCGHYEVRTSSVGGGCDEDIYSYDGKYFYIERIPKIPSRLYVGMPETGPGNAHMLKTAIEWFDEYKKYCLVYQLLKMLLACDISKKITIRLLKFIEPGSYYQRIYDGN